VLKRQQVLDLQQELRDALSMRGKAGVPVVQEPPQDCAHLMPLWSLTPAAIENATTSCAHLSHHKLCTFDAAWEPHAGGHQKRRQDFSFKVLECPLPGMDVDKKERRRRAMMGGGGGMMSATVSTMQTSGGSTKSINRETDTAACETPGNVGKDNVRKHSLSFRAFRDFPEEGLSLPELELQEGMMTSPGIRACRKMIVNTNITAGHAGGAQIPSGHTVHEVRLEAALPEGERLIDKRRRVLVVDEDAGHCKVVSKFLAKDFADLHVDVAFDAEAALQLLVASVSSPASESSCAGDYDLVLITGPEISGRPIVDLVRSFREVQEGQEPGAQEAGIEGRGGGGGENFRERKVEFVAAVKTNEDAIALYARAWPEVARGGGDARCLSGDSILMKPIKREPLRALVCAALLEIERREERPAEGNMPSKHRAQDGAGGRKQSAERKASAVHADGKGFYQQTWSHDLTEPGGMDLRQAFAAPMQSEDAARGRAGYVLIVVHAEEEVEDRVVAMDTLASGPALARAPELQEMLGARVSEALQGKVSACDSDEDCEDAVAHSGDATMAQDHKVHGDEPVAQLVQGIGQELQDGEEQDTTANQLSATETPKLPDPRASVAAEATREERGDGAIVQLMLELQRELQQGLQAQADSMQELYVQVQRLQGDMQMQSVAMQETQKLLQDSSDRARPHSSTLSTSSTSSTPSTPAAQEQRVQRIEDETTRVAARACTTSAKRDPGPLEGIGNGVAGGGRGHEHVQAPCARVSSPGASSVRGESGAARSSRHNVIDDRRRRVLVVDEDRGHCKVVSKLLAKDFADLHVDVAFDAETALQLLVASVSSPASESSCAGDYDLVLITGPEISGRPIVDLVYRVRSFRQVRRRAWRSRQEVEFVAVVKTAEEVTALEELAWHEVGREGQNVMMKPIKREPLRVLVSQVLLHRERSDDNSNDNNVMVSRQSPPRTSKRPTPSGRRVPLDGTGI
jgi:CheY-like chemotaxis protein